MATDCLPTCSANARLTTGAGRFTFQAVSRSVNAARPPRYTCSIPMSFSGLGNKPMVRQTVLVPDPVPPLPPGLTVEQRIALWGDLLDACDQLLLAGLRRRIGPDGDLRAAYRESLARQREEHDRMLLGMADRFNRRGGRHGG